MIPRAARRLKTTSLSSRQALPRPARLYSSPSKPSQAPATATATTHAGTVDFPPFPVSKSANPEISNFLSQEVPLTLIPAPEPLTSASKAADPWFADSKAHGMVGIIDACLHNLHDVHRAQEVFSRLRQWVGSAALTVRIYNSFLASYLKMAEKEEFERERWIDEAWSLYDVLESGREGPQPTPKTYSIMMSALEQYGPKSPHELEVFGTKDAEYLLSRIVEREIPIMDVVSNPYFTSPDIMAAIAKKFATAAYNLGFKDIIQELGYSDATPPDRHLEGVPEVNPVTTEVKLADDETSLVVPYNIESLRRRLKEVAEARTLLDNDLIARQKHLEESVYDLALEQLAHRDEIYQSKIPKNRNLQHWIWTWHKAMEVHLAKVIKAATTVLEQDAREQALELEEGAKPPRKKKRTPEEVKARLELKQMDDILPCLTLVPLHKLSLLTILELLRMQGGGGVVNGVKATAALITIGKAVENEYKMEVCRQAKIPITMNNVKGTNYFTRMGYNHLHERRIAAARSQERDEKWQADWSQALRAKVGAFLVNSLQSLATVSRTKVDPKTGELLTETQPAIFNSYEFVRGHKLGVIKINEEITERIAQDSLSRTIHARHLPMLVKPRPWVNYDDGGYFYNRSTAMRFKESIEQERYLREATDAGAIELVYAGLDILGSTPWKVNRAIFDSVVKVWNSGERMGKLPPAQYEEPEPVLPEGKEQDIRAKAHHILRHKKWAQAKAANHSERCSVNYKIEIARTFLGDTMYVPHNLDFRGRAYPIPPHLNHIGDDLSRALLMFSEAKPLGARGFRWLKIHAANLYGYDKANFEERVGWVEEHIQEIIESANNPLNGSGWWKKADDPWQFLATCIELKNAMELEDPTTYACALPIHQDGTCNGLQHYAALGGDAKGAEQVNLLASDRPSDVYSHIGSMVEDALTIDAAAGNAMAKILKGKISRKVVKQTVMTTVYGVTFIGAREQIENRLRDRGDIPAELCWEASSYLAKKVLETIGDAFKGAKNIQDWLTTCARIITKSIPESRLALKTDVNGKVVVSVPQKQIKKEQMTSVIWTTALGLPIVQPYRKTVRKQIRTQMQTVFISDPQAVSEVNSTKQASAFPPNFIHSLDATHMMLSALECRNRSITFASVHDSYWTHACDVDTMSEIIRETFIDLHSSDIMGRLDQEFRERYKGHQVPLEAITKIGRGGSGIIKKLKAAGTRIYARRDQAHALGRLQDIVIFNDEKSSIAEVVDANEAAEINGAALEGTTASKEGEATEESEHDEEESVQDQDASMDLLAGKFVRLTDLIPPLPLKGTFKVENIKASLYFFS